MTKTDETENAKKTDTHDPAEDRENDANLGEQDDDEEDDDEGIAHAKPAERPKRHRDHDDHAHADRDEDDDAAAAPDVDDPSWWAPHAVLGALVVVGVLGFFGVFNKALSFIPKPAPPGETTSAAATTAAATAKPATPPTPREPPKDQAPREMFGAKHLLVMYKGGRRAPPTVERSKDDAKVRATEAMKKAKAGGKDKFVDFVKEYSDEPNAAQRGGDLGQFPKGSMVPEFQTALEKLKVDEISDIVETPFGYHVILRTK